MRNVPVYAMVPKDEYHRLRKALNTTCAVHEISFMETWDLMIHEVEKRHARVVAGKAKADMKLDEAVPIMQDKVREESRRRLAEREQASKLQRLMGRAK